MKIAIAKSATSKLIEVFIQDASATDGSGLAGLVYNTANLVAYYYREGAASAVLVDSGGATPLVTMTLGTWVNCGFIAIDGTNMPGWYQVGLPDAMLLTGADSVCLVLRGAANMAPCCVEIQLGADLSDGVRAGLSALPTAAPDAENGLPIVDANGRTAANVEAMATDSLAAAAVKADAVTKIQAGLSTYAGGAVASVSGAVGSVAGNVDGNVTGSVGSVGSVVSANLVQILGTALTETAGYLAAGFKKLFNVATPVLTAESVNQTGDAFGRIGAAGASLTALGDTRIANLDAAVSTRSTLAAGAEMDLVDAPNSTAVTAIQSGLATGTNVSDLQTHGDSEWATADVSGLELTGAAAAAVATLNDLDAAAVLAQVNAALNTAIPGTPTANSINERIKALDDLLQAAGSGDAAVIKAATDALAAIMPLGVFTAPSLANAPTGGTAPTVEQIDTQLSGTHGAGSWLSGAGGSGANTVVVTVQTAGGTTFEGVRVSVNNQTETGSPLVQYTDADGEATFYLDSDDWRAIAGADGAQSGGATNFTVDGAEAVTVTVTAVTLPATTDPDNYLLYGYARKLEADAAFGAAGMTVKVLRVDPGGQVDAAADATRAIMGTSYSTNAAGLWSFEIAQALAGYRLKLQFAWTDADSVVQTEEWEAEILASAANESDQIAWADLSPAKKS